MYAARLEALWASKSPKATADGKIEDFDAAPSERPKWPLPLSFFFSPRAAFHLPGVPALRSAKALSSGLQPRKRGLRPAVTEGDRKMMQLEKMNISFFRRVLTLSTPRGRGFPWEAAPLSIDKPIFPVWGCMKGPQPLHIFAPASAYAGPGFRFANNVCEPPAAQSAAFDFSPRAAFHLPGVPPAERMFRSPRYASRVRSANL